MASSAGRLAALALLLLGLPLGTARAVQRELPVFCDEAREPIAIAYGERAECSVATATNLDQFIFAGTAGDVVRINATSRSACLDLRVEVRDPGGSVLLDAHCNGASGGQCIKCSLDSRTLELPVTGQYRMLLSDSGTNGTGDYTIQLEKLVPDSAPGIAYNSSETDELLVADVDFLAFEAAAGSTVRMNLASQTGCLDVRLEVVDPAGEVIANRACSGASGGQCVSCAIAPLDVPLPSAGIYYAVISDVGANGGGRYQLGLDCIGGSCPTSPPACTPSSACDQGDPCFDDICDFSEGCVHIPNERPGCLAVTTTSVTTTSTTTSSSTTTTTTNAGGTTSTTLNSTPTTTTPVSVATTTTQPPPACQQLSCNGGNCTSEPVADGTACDDGDGCAPDACHAGTCTNDPLCGQTVAAQPPAKPSGKSVNAIAIRCSVEGADGTCEAQGFVSKALADDLLGRNGKLRPAAAPSQAVDEVVVVTKKGSAKFDKFGVARFSLKLNKLGKRMLKKASQRGLRLPVTIHFVVRDGETVRELDRLVELAQTR